MKVSHLPLNPGWSVCDIHYTCGYPFRRVCPWHYATTPNPCGEVIDVSFDIIFGSDSGV